MFDKNYYCLVAGLREYSLDADTKGFNARAIIEEILEGVSARDARCVRLLYGYYDCENLVNFRKGRAAHNPLGNLSREEIEEQTKNPDRLPARMATVVRSYSAIVDEDADNEADQTNDGVQVAAADTDHHTQRAAQEHQGTDHNEHTQYKAQGRGGTAAAFEFLKAKSSDEGAQYNADDLGADVLDHACGVQAQGTGGIPQEARNTEAHVAGVAQRSQQYGSSTYHQTGRHNQPVYFFHGINLSLS